MNNQLLAHLVDINTAIRSTQISKARMVSRNPSLQNLRRRPLTIWGRIKRFFFAP